MKPSARAASATQRCTPARASSRRVPGSRPMRQSTSHQAGVLLAQSPPRITPGLNLIGSGMAPNQGSDAAARFSAAVCSCKRQDQVVGGHDRVGAGLRPRHVHRHAAHAQAEPHHADMGAGDGGVGRLRDQHRVGAVAAGQGGERAVAGAFLLRHGLHVDVGRRLQPGVADRVQREHHRRHALLHVAGAAAVQPLVPDRRLERRGGPQLRRARWARRRHGPAGSGCGRRARRPAACPPPARRGL